MNTLLKMVAATGLAASFAAPAFAQDAMVDPMTMTCADFSAMDSAGMMTATQHLDMVMAMTPEEQTAAMAMTPEEKTAAMAEMDAAMAAMTEEEKTAAMAETEASMARLTTACTDKPEGTVMDAAKSGT